MATQRTHLPLSSCRYTDYVLERNDEDPAHQQEARKNYQFRTAHWAACAKILKGVIFDNSDKIDLQV